MIQTALNEPPLRRLGAQDNGTFRTLSQVMTGSKPVRCMLHSNYLGKEEAKFRKLEKVRATQILNVEKLQNAFEEMCRDIHEKVSKIHRKQIRHHNKKTSLVTPNFNVGDVVLVRRTQDEGHKHSFGWVGPRRVTNVISEFVYGVENIISKKQDTVRAATIILYRADMENKEVSKALLEQIEYEEKIEWVDELMEIAEDIDFFYSCEMVRAA